MTVDNERLVAWVNIKYWDYLRKELDERKKQLDILHRQHEIMEEEFRLLDQVDEVYEGVALSNFTDNISAVDRNLTSRSGRIYLNQRNHKTYGAHLYDNAYGRRGEDWIGAAWESLEELETVVKDWVVKGIKPVEKDRKYREPS